MAKNKKEDKLDPELRNRIDNIINSIETACNDELGAKEILGVVISYLEDEQFLAVPLIEALANNTKPEIAQFLYDMMDGIQDKSLIKLIKRSLYKLRQKGVKWEEKSQKDEPILKPLESAEPEGYLGDIDNSGSRIVIVTRNTPRGFLVAFSVVNDLEGLQKLDLSQFSKKGFKEFLESSVSSVDFPIVEAQGAYCISLLKEAAALSKNLSNPLPQGYLDIENEFKGIVWDYSRPVIYQHISEDEIKEKPHFLKESGELHKIAPFFAWSIDPKELEQYIASIEEAHDSRIVLTPSQKDARLNSIYHGALESIFPDEKRLIWKRRLEETAYILFKTGKDKEARQALSAAMDLRNPFSTIEPNPFIWNLLLKSFYSEFEEDSDEKDEEKKSSLIIAP
ncbi:MAG: hypothetical protein U9R17_07100 [Thermodesulfobacteriota bacterium]|nr:hypothetical protein [Thermodesulfobacteriota bacterium]